MGTRTASPRGRYGERLSVTRSEDTYEKTPPVGRRQPMTSLPAYHNISAAGRIHHQLFRLPLTGLFEACRVNLGKSTVFLTLLWRALARRLGSVWIRVLVIWHPMTHTTVASFVWAWSRTRCPWGGGLRALWAALYRKLSSSPVPLFEERGAAVCFPRFKIHRCRGTEANEIVGSQLLGADKLEGTAHLFARRPRTRVSCWIVMMRSFWHH